MKVILRQNDILTNKSMNPNIDEMYYYDKKKYQYNLNERINKRLDQLNILNTLINNDLDDNEYINLVLKAYYLKYEYQKKLNLNIIASNNLSIIVNTNSDFLFEDKIYTLKEIISFYTYYNVFLKNTNIIYFNK